MKNRTVIVVYLINNKTEEITFKNHYPTVKELIDNIGLEAQITGIFLD